MAISGIQLPGTLQGTQRKLGKLAGNWVKPPEKPPVLVMGSIYHLPGQPILGLPHF